MPCHGTGWPPPADVTWDGAARLRRKPRRRRFGSARSCSARRGCSWTRRLCARGFFCKCGPQSVVFARASSVPVAKKGGRMPRNGWAIAAQPHAPGAEGSATVLPAIVRTRSRLRMRIHVSRDTARLAPPWYASARPKAWKLRSLGDLPARCSRDSRRNALSPSPRYSAGKRRLHRVKPLHDRMCPLSR